MPVITGSDNRSAHLIDEVMLDLSFDCDVIEGIHEDRLTTWVIDELLPVLESVLNANDEAGTVLHIHQITIDLGDISDADYFGQMIQRFREKLDLELSKIRWNRQPVDALQQSVAQTVSGQHHTRITDTPVAQHVTRLQFNLGLLRHFLLSGNMPWHVNITESNAHERLIDRILYETQGATALRTLLIQMASTHRKPLIQRLIYQYSNEYLGKILAASLSMPQDELSHWLVSVHSALPKTSLTPAQRIAAETRLWEYCFEAAFAAPDTFTAHDILVAVRQSLRKTTALQPHDENVLNGSPLQNTHHSGKPETSAVMSRDAETSQTPAQSDVMLLFQYMAETLQKAGLHYAGLASEDFYGKHLTAEQRDTAVAWLWQQLLESAAGAPDTLAASELPAAARQTLHKTTALQPHDENVLNGSPLQNTHHSGKPETSAVMSRDAETSQTPAQSDVMLLFQYMAETLQKAGLHYAGLASEDFYGKHLTAEQRDTAVAWLWKQLFEPATGAPDTLAASELPAAVRQSLHKTTESQPHDENVLNGSLLQDTHRSGKLATPTVASSDAETSQTSAQSDVIPLFHRIVEALQKAGLPGINIAPGEFKAIDSKDIRQRVLEILRDAMRDEQRLVQLPESVLIDMIYLLSPQMAVLLEQLLLHAEIFYRHTMHRKPANSVEWKQQLWRNTLNYCAALSSSEVASDSVRFMPSIVHHLSHDLEGYALLQCWHTALSSKQDNSAGINTVLNMLIERIRPAEIKPHVSDAIQEKKRFIAIIVQRILSAVRKAGWSGADAIFHDFDAATTMHSVRQQLSILLQNDTVRAILTDRLSSDAMNDIVYLLSPGNAVILEQLARLTEIPDAQPAHPWHANNAIPHAESERLRQLLYRNALNILASRKITGSDSAPAEIMSAHDFITSLVRVMSAVQDDRALAALWQESLQRVEMMPEQGSVRILSVLKSLLFESGVPGVSAYPVVQARQEIQHITAGMATDFAAQKQRLQTVFSNDKRIMGQLSAPELRNLVYAVLTHNPELTEADHRTLDAAITQFAEKTRNQSAYYYRILENLLFDQLIDLESIAGQITHSGGIDTDTPESTKPPVNEKQRQSFILSGAYPTVIFRRVLSSLKQAGMTTAAGHFQEAPETMDVHAIRQGLTEILQVVSIRMRLIERLPQSVLLDIVHLMSPHAALYLEQVLLQTDAFAHPAAEKHRVNSTDWKQQIWKNALRFLATQADSDVFDAKAFIQALVHPLSGDTAFTAMLLKSGQDPEKENDSPQLRKKENWSAIVQSLIAETVVAAAMAQPATSVSESVHPAIPARHDIQQILTALETDFERQRQYLKTAYDTGRLRIDRLTRVDAKAIIQALLIHDPGLAGEDRDTFVEAMETHARKASNQLVYYQRILAKLLSGLEIDLEAITLGIQPAQTASAPIPGQPESEAELLYANAGTDAVLQRILPAVERLNAEAGSVESDLLLRNLQTRRLTTIREQLVSSLRNPHFRTQCIAGLPQPVLLDITFILSPAAAAMIEQLLTQSAVLQRSAAKQQDTGIEFWKLKLWEAALGFLTKLSISGSWIAGFDGADFLHALIVELAGSEPFGTILRHWIDTLAQIPGTRVLQHLLNGLLRRQNIRMDVAGNAEIEAPAFFAGKHGHSGQIYADSPVMTDFEYPSGEEFYIDNAGQVLAAPYLPRLFSLLGLIDADVFIDRTAAGRAVHLLQFMVNAKNESPEYQLLLNKILCGLSPGIPVQSRVMLSPHEHDTIEGLMRGMIQNWKTIGNTSISGLRETFLQRRGRLILQEEIWFLTVEPGPFDMLLDNLPWSFSVIKHRWMERAIHVTWR